MPNEKDLTFEQLERPVEITLTVGEWLTLHQMLRVHSEIVDVLNCKEKYSIHLFPILKKMFKQTEGVTNENLSKLDH